MYVRSTAETRKGNVDDISSVDEEREDDVLQWLDTRYACAFIWLA